MKLSLRLILLLGLAGLQLIAVTIVVSSSYLTSERALLGHARDLLSDVAANTIQHSRSFLSPAKAAAELATRLAENEIVSSQDKSVLEKLLFQQLGQTPQFSGIFYGDEVGDFVYVMRSNGAGPIRSKTIDHSSGARETSLIWRTLDFSEVEARMDPADTYDPRERPWYQRAATARDVIWTDPYIFFSSQKPGITVASPVINQKGILKGVVGVDIEIDSISDFLADLKIGTEGKALILNQNGDVIAHSQADLIIAKQTDGSLGFQSIDEIDDPVARTAFADLDLQADGSRREERTSVHRVNGADYVTTVTPAMSDVLPWTIAVFAPQSDFIGAIQQNRALNTAIALLTAAITGAIGLYIAGYINRPIQALAARATEISQGNYRQTETIPMPFAELEQADQTMTREAERRKQFEAQYSLMFDRGARGMAEISPRTGQLQRVNQRFGKILGMTEEALLRSNIDTLFDTGGKSALHISPADAMAGDGIPKERQFQRPDGENVWMSVNSLVLSGADGAPHHAVVTLDDITRSKQAEAQIQKLSRDLSHNARLNMMGQMAAGLAHELNQPLTSITQNADSALIHARNKCPEDANLEDILADIEKEAFRAAEIIRALRGFLRKDEITAAPFDLRDLIDQTIGLVGPEAREHSVKIDATHGDLPPLLGSRVQIAQVLVNLLRNAIEAMAAEKSATREIQITSEPTDTGVKVTVQDTGPGIAPGISLFERFETTKETGMGLGLSICRTIVEHHGGRLWHADSPTGGCFVFTLPRSEPND